MIDWLLVPENDALITWIGFALGVIGGLVGGIGLWVALVQLSAIKTETEAASAAIKQVQLKVASFDTIQQCNNARSQINEIKAQLHGGKWIDVLKSYEALIEIFLMLAHSNSNIDEDDREALRKQTIDMAKFCEAIRKKSLQEGQAMVLRGQDAAIRDFSDTMTKVNFAVMRDLQR
jgi:hypothetical protein